MNKQLADIAIINQRRRLLETELNRCLELLTKHYQPQKVLLRPCKKTIVSKQFKI